MGAVQLRQPVVRDAGGTPDGTLPWQRCENLPFTAEPRRDVQGYQLVRQPVDNFDFQVHGRFDPFDKGSFFYPSLDLGIGIHEADDAGGDAGPGNGARNGFKVAKIVLAPAGGIFKKTDGVETPLDRAATMVAAQLRQLVQTLFQPWQVGFQQTMGVLMQKLKKRW